jgi:hypothetical protein
VDFRHILESTIGTALAMVLVLGGRQLAARASYRAALLALKLRGRTK